MTKPELGVKRDCPECGVRFYDLNKEPAHCPKCEHEFFPEPLLKPRKSPKEEESANEGAEAAKPTQETSLDAADKEKRAPESKRRPSLDEDDDAQDEDDELADIEDIDVDIDDDDDDSSILDDDDDDDDVTNIVKPGGESDD